MNHSTLRIYAQIFLRLPRYGWPTNKPKNMKKITYVSLFALFLVTYSFSQKRVVSNEIEKLVPLHLISIRVAALSKLLWIVTVNIRLFMVAIRSTRCWERSIWSEGFTRINWMPY